MNILITGATGLIGSKLIDSLIDDTSSHTLYALTRNKEKASEQLPKSVNIITDLSSLDFNILDIVINLAGEPIAERRWTKTQKEKIAQSRWQLTQQIADKINSAENPPKCFISGSAIGFYGRQDNIKITESFSDIHEEFTHSICKTWEDIALRTQNKTRVCLLRTGIVLDKAKGALAKMLIPFRLGLGGPIGSGRQYMSWIHIDDMVGGIMILINNQELKGVFNFTAPEPVTNKEFSINLAKTMNKPCFITTPNFMMKLMLGEMSSLILHGQRVMPEKLQAADYKFKYNDIFSALNNLLE